VLLGRIADTSSAVAASTARLKKIELLADTLRELRPEEVAVGVAYLSGVLPHAPIGVGWAALRERPAPVAEPALELLEVDAALRRVGETAGAGSQQRRRAELAALFGRATEPEQRFLVGLLLGELRQGAQEGVMADAVARAAGVPATSVRRASMVAGDLREVAVAALHEGERGLDRFGLAVLRPLQPMLAQTADDVRGALDRTGAAVLEWKLDGARLQVHRLDGEVRAFTRNLADVTDRVPEVVAAVRDLPLRSVVLDGEVISLQESGRPRPFQVTMSRFGTRRGGDDRSAGVPLSPFFFDCLHLDGVDLLDRPLTERLAALDERLPQELRVPRLVTDDPLEGERFLADVIARGHEGVMVKALDAPYEAGRRGSGWLKVKQAHTLDLVVLAAEWGHGRRTGRLSNLHLGARDEQAGGFVMLGKTFKGMTDEMLAWQTERLLELESGRSGHTVHVRPELVVEVAFDGVQRSSRYPGGVALRFARVKGYRPDKRPDEADTIETVQALHGGG
jgi:DNA ligase-1